MIKEAKKIVADIKASKYKTEHIKQIKEEILSNTVSKNLQGSMDNTIAWLPKHS